MSLNGVYYLSKERIRFDMAVGFEYQNNQTIWKKASFPVFYEDGYSEKVNAAYYSPFIASSFLFSGKRKHGRYQKWHGLSLKAAYNIADHYNDQVRVDAYAGIEQASPKDNEPMINLTPYPFISLEPAYNFVVYRKRSVFRVQAGYNYRYATLQHHYYFAEEVASPQIYSKTRQHPTMNFVNINVGWVFFLGRKKENASATAVSQ